MDIKIEKSATITLSKEDLMKHLSSCLSLIVGIESDLRNYDITDITDVTRSEEFVISNTESDSVEYFDGIKINLTRRAN